MNKSTTKVVIKNNIRIYISDYKSVCQKIMEFHKYNPFPNLIMANAIAAFGPISFLYNSDFLMFKISSSGPLKNIIVEIKNDNIRSLIANPNIVTEYDEKEYNSIPMILGIGNEGTMLVSRNVKGKTFSSHTPLVRSDIITDLTYYLNVSDQIFSAVVNDVELDKENSNIIKKANNVLFQLLPSHTEEDVKWIESFIKKHPLKNYSINEYEKLIDGQFYKEWQIDAKCWCSKDKAINSIRMLSNEEIEDIFTNEKLIQINCDFCENKYKINKEDL